MQDTRPVSGFSPYNARPSITLTGIIVQLPLLFLKRREERRIQAGHPWVFSNEVDVERSPLSAFEPGTQVCVLSHAEQPLGSAYVNPATLICARMVSRQANRPLDEALIRTRLQRALDLRERMGVGPYYRLVYGESDGLPGLVVDRFGTTLSVQIATAGMQALFEPLMAALEKVVQPAQSVLRNDGIGRQLEGLDESVQWLRGNADEPVEIVENTARFSIWPGSGQKTGWFYDHRLNRARVAAWSKQARILDLCSYRGAFGVQAALGGAASVLCVDSSKEALEGAIEAATLNGCSDRVSSERGDVFEVLRSLYERGERFDLVIADPPAFARRKRDLKSAQEAYRRLNRLAMRVLVDDGLLFSASCSSHLDSAGLKGVLRHAASAAQRQIVLLETGHQGPDHPIHPAMPESAYLKAFLGRVSS
jgi:23S rRNA (cytosine1962-C5)-methyltransferase